MRPSATERAQHIKRSIALIRQSLAGLSREDVLAQPMLWSGFERQIEIISEASRGLPDAWKTEFGDGVHWRDVANTGNFIRHVYHQLNVSTLWKIYTDDLDPLEAAIDAMIAAHPSD